MAWTRRRTPEEKCAEPAPAREKALELLTGQDFSCQGLYERLCRRFTDEAAAYAVSEMVRLHLLDDARYAKIRARSLLLQHKSRRAILDALRRKGVDRQLAADTLDELYAEQEPGQDPELEAAAALVQRQYARRLAEGRQDLVLAALARRGFSYRVARDAVASMTRQA